GRALGGRTGCARDARCGGAADVPAVASPQRDDLDLLDLLPQEARADFPEVRLIVRDHEAMLGRPLPVGRELALGELAFDGLRRLIGAVAQGHTRPQPPAE